jgi:hypothetical protein
VAEVAVVGMGVMMDAAVVMAVVAMAVEVVAATMVVEVVVVIMVVEAVAIMIAVVEVVVADVVEFSFIFVYVYNYVLDKLEHFIKYNFKKMLQLSKHVSIKKFIIFLNSFVN